MYCDVIVAVSNVFCHGSVFRWSNLSSRFVVFRLEKYISQFVLLFSPWILVKCQASFLVGLAYLIVAFLPLRVQHVGCYKNCHYSSTCRVFIAVIVVESCLTATRLPYITPPTGLTQFCQLSPGSNIFGCSIVISPWMSCLGLPVPGYYTLVTVRILRLHLLSKLLVAGLKDADTLKSLSGHIYYRLSFVKIASVQILWATFPAPAVLSLKFHPIVVLWNL